MVLFSQKKKKEEEEIWSLVQHVIQNLKNYQITLDTIKLGKLIYKQNRNFLIDGIAKKCSKRAFHHAKHPKLSFENLNQPFLASYKSSKEAFNYVPPSFPKFSSPFIFCLGWGGGRTWSKCLFLWSLVSPFPLYKGTHLDFSI